ncbi:unnamed protein product [Timema podura]|uniref:Uncharacterized protein n=1 Tax=Timema podura TaxID=61482 RepID=A0ABN7PBB4_TIMPD|nr:unnamed protein product [Timema podura]
MNVYRSVSGTTGLDDHLGGGRRRWDVSLQSEASVSSDDSSSVSTYENLENSLRESTHSEIDLNSSVLDLGADFGGQAADCDGASVVSECTNADVNHGGVFAIHLPSPAPFSRLNPEDRPCITLEHATQSEA